jgi:hypothetical protein
MPAAVPVNGEKARKCGRKDAFGRLDTEKFNVMATNDNVPHAYPIGRARDNG